MLISSLSALLFISQDVASLLQSRAIYNFWSKDMKVKTFTSSIFRLPARVVGALFALVFGDYGRNRDGSINEKTSFLGVLGLILEGIKAILDLGRGIGRLITSFIKSYERAIATAFWLSLLVGSAAALTVAYWPAALVAVVNFSLAGYSIAALVGADFAAQVAATAAVAALATSAAVYAVTTAVTIADFILSCCSTDNSSANDDEFISSQSPVETHVMNARQSDFPPAHFNSPLASKATTREECIEPSVVSTLNNR
jgi:hypothetical protein